MAIGASASAAWYENFAEHMQLAPAEFAMSYIMRSGRIDIERLHKLMKYDYGDERLTKRGNDAFQARLDKTLLAMHLILARD